MFDIDFVIRLVICLSLGILIGIERQLRRRIVGLRTNVLVSAGAFLFVSAAYISQPDEKIRMASQVISGIGFLGAGLILKDGNKVKGLNTAATLWCSASVGVLCACNLILEAICGTFLILFVNIFLRFIAIKIGINTKKQVKNHFSLKVTCSSTNEKQVRKTIIKTIQEYNILLTNLESHNQNKNTTITCDVVTTYKDIDKIEEVLGSINNGKDILSISWEVDSRDEQEKIIDEEES